MVSVALLSAAFGLATLACAGRKTCCEECGPKAPEPTAPASPDGAATPAPVPVPAPTPQEPPAVTNVEFTIPEVSVGELGGTVTIPVTLLIPKGVEVAAVSFDVSIPSTLLTYRSGTLVGFGASSKDLTAKEFESGTVKVIVFGMNKNPIPFGARIELTFDVAKRVEAGLSLVGDIRVEKADAATPDAKRLTVVADHGKFGIKAGE